jgi:hypothetical protein
MINPDPGSALAALLMTRVNMLGHLAVRSRIVGGHVYALGTRGVIEEPDEGARIGIGELTSPSSFTLERYNLALNFSHP